MSAGPAPPNPHAPKKPPNPAPFLQRVRPSYVVTAIALLGTAYLYFNKPASPRDNPIMNISTPGMKNIEKAYTNAGATPTHTPAYGGTKQGDGSVHIREGGANTGTGADGASPFKQDGVGDDQRPATQTKGGQIFDQSMTGSHKGEHSNFLI